MCFVVILLGTQIPAPAVVYRAAAATQGDGLVFYDTESVAKVLEATPTEPPQINENPPYFLVPFYSQFRDITAVRWQKVSCGVASLAMIIDYYSSEEVSADQLLQTGLASHAYLDDAGWIHTGLINLAKPFGLDGATHSLAHLTNEAAFAEFRSVVADGPVIVSVHYTFDQNNPIPHLAVVTGIDDERVYYNDPADTAGGNSVSITQFLSAWKKRYIEIRPT